MMIGSHCRTTIFTIMRVCGKSCAHQVWLVVSIVSSAGCGFLQSKPALAALLNIKVGRIRRFSEALAVHEVCQAHKIPVWCGGMLETGIGRAQNIALSTLPNFSLPGDVSASKRYWKEDIIEPEVEVSPHGMIAIGDEPDGISHQARFD